jgi:hypothetical protein
VELRKAEGKSDRVSWRYPRRQQCEHSYLVGCSNHIEKQGGAAAFTGYGGEGYLPASGTLLIVLQSAASFHFHRHRLQVRALQDLLRSNAEELEKYRKIIAEGGSSGQNNSATAIKQAELQERITKTRSELKDAEKLLSEAEAPASGAGEAGALSTSGELLAKITDLKAVLAQAELEAEAGASEAVKATRARERIEKEARDKQMALENALEVKVKENAALMESMSNMESTHAKDLEVSCIAAGHLLS